MIGGNELARAAMADAMTKGQTPDEVYDNFAGHFDGLTIEQRAECEGYLACLVGRPRESNPYPFESIFAAARDRWDTGWLGGQTGDFSSLSWRVHVFQGGD